MNDLMFGPYALKNSRKYNRWKGRTPVGMVYIWRPKGLPCECFIAFAPPLGGSRFLGRGSPEIAAARGFKAYSKLLKDMEQRFSKAQEEL